jgi:hypothetical protein
MSIVNDVCQVKRWTFVNTCHLKVKSAHIFQSEIACLNESVPAYIQEITSAPIYLFLSWNFPYAYMQCGDRNRMRTYPSAIDLSWSSMKMKKKDFNFNLRWCNSVFEMQRWSYLNWFALFNTSFAIYVVLVLPWNFTAVHLNPAFEVFTAVVFTDGSIYD